jgi:3-hydroxybutyryl-CoA dehydrogenase
MKATHENRGPFGLLDLVGLKTALEITEYGSRVTGSPQVRKNADFLRAAIENGGLGLAAGHGFYTYPDPAFEGPEFLSPQAPQG